MAEYKWLVKDRMITYHGMFDKPGLYQCIERWRQEHGYSRWEQLAGEQVTDEGRQVRLRLWPFKKVSEYTRIQMDLRLFVNRMKQREVMIDGIPRIVNEGEIELKSDVYLMTDYEHALESKPFFYFMRTIYEKFISRTEMQRYEKACIDDLDNLLEEIKAFLNLQGFKAA